MVSSGDSATTQPYAEEDECEQLVDSAGYSTPAKANAANANSMPSHGISPTSKTPSPFPLRRPNVHTNAAAAADSRDPYTARISRANIGSVVSQAAWNNDHVRTKDCFDDPLSAGKVNAPWTHTSELAGSASLLTRDVANGLTSPLRTHCERSASGSTTPGTGTDAKRSETQQTRKRNVSRVLFQDSNLEKTRRTSASGVEQSVPERNCPAVQFVRPPKANIPGGEIFRLPLENVGQPCANSPNVTGNEQWRHIFGEKQVIRYPHSKRLLALGRLDFTTAFRVLESLKGRTLEESSLTVYDIEKLENVPKANVETYLLQIDGLRTGGNYGTRETKSLPANPRFECCVNHKGRLEFKISEQKERLTALQRYFGPDKVLRVFFADLPECKKLVSAIMKEGIFVGLRHYQYWTHKDTKKDYENKKTVDEKFWSSIHCYFVCTSSRAESDRNCKEFSTIFEARCSMMHIHTTADIPKYISRLQLALSDTEPVDLDICTINVQVVDDMHCKDEETGLETVCTDGTGYISVDLAKEVAVCLKNRMEDPEKFGTQEYPSLIQIRLFYKGSANKGTLLAHNTLGPRTIVLRKSMQKVVPDPRLSDFKSFNSLEICGWSNPPRDAKLSRDLILLLTLGGVPGSFFLDLVDEAIHEVRGVLNDNVAAWRAIRGDDSEMAVKPKKMLLAGIPPKEPYLQGTLMKLRKDLLQDFRQGKVFLPDSCYLYGTADPTGTLKPNQVAITLGHGLVFWPKVAVYKSPGRHPGDIHIFEAVANKELQDVVGSGKYVIFFSTQGSRSIPTEIANGDLDGDKYLITWNRKLLADYVESPTRWFPEAEQSTEHGHVRHRPADLQLQVLRDKIVEKYIDMLFNPSNDIGRVSNWCLVHFDLYLSRRESDPVESVKHYEQALDLIDLFCKLVDSEKTGKKEEVPMRLRPRITPHFLEKKGNRFQEQSRRSPIMKDKNFGFGLYVNLDMDMDTDMEYHSTTILGQIYDKAIRAEESWRLQSQEIEFEQAFSYTRINGVTGQEFHDLCTKWRDLFNTYKGEMSSHLGTANSDTKAAGCDFIFLKYRRILYGADSFDKTRTDLDKIFANASALYWVVYDAGIKSQRESHGGDRDPSLCFAWSVAGAALFTMYEKHYRPDGEEQLIVARRPFECFFGKQHSRYLTEADSPPSSP